MTQEAAACLVAEQPRTAPRSSLHRLGRRLNKTMKLVLAVPSNPHQKTYSKSHLHPSHREIPLPYGVGALGFQGRVPTTAATRSRPATAGSQRSANRPKQSGETFRRPSGPTALQMSHHGSQSRPNEYRGSDATREPYRPPNSHMPAHKSGQDFSTAFSDAGTLMPIQKQLGSPNWERALAPLPDKYTP
jgi:hypothetical protein